MCHNRIKCIKSQLLCEEDCLVFIVWLKTAGMISLSTQEVKMSGNKKSSSYKGAGKGVNKNVEPGLVYNA